MRSWQWNGWRLDVANEVDKNFWRKFRTAVRSANPEAVLIGEVWENAEVWLKGDMFDSVMNYDFRKHCRDFFAMRNTRADGFAWGMTDMLLRYPEQVSRGQLNLLDSHDVPRFYSLCGEDYERWQAAFLYLCMAPGVPSVFYGDECRVGGIREDEYRRAMPWKQDHAETRQFVKTAIGIRKKWIKPSDEWRVMAADAAENLLVFERVGKSRVRVAIHQGENRVDAASYLAGGEILLRERMEGKCLGRNGFAVCLMRE